MQDSQRRISEAEASKILAIAAHLDANNQKSYSLEDLVQAGEQVNIPATYTYEALLQVQAGVDTPTSAVSSDSKRSLSTRQLKHQYLLPILGTIIGLVISIPLYPATKSGEYPSLNELIRMEMLTTGIRIFPPGLGLVAGIWGQRQLRKRLTSRQSRQ